MGLTRIGNNKARLALKRWGDAIEGDVKRIVVETATLLMNHAKALAPVDSGNLKRSIEMDVLNGGLTALVRVSADYAIYIEFGTGIYAVEGNGRKTPWTYRNPKTGEWVTTQGMRAQPFWFPAIDKASEHFKNEMQKLGR